uniref:Immunoglobulin heavy variable 5-3 n=1 Tax=Sinocyclocheilus grahami TaxID=75366 RepID=A0A672K2Q1_SINGR
MVLSPGQVLTLSCKISGYSVTDSSYWTHWIQQPAGKALEWVGEICGDGNTYYSDKLKSRFQITRESSSNTVTLQGQNMQTEDTAVYYCTPTASLYKNTIIISQIKRVFDDFPHSDFYRCTAIV